MVDYQFRAAVDVEAGRPNVNGYTKAVDQCLILDDVVGHGEMEVNRVPELASI